MKSDVLVMFPFAFSCRSKVGHLFICLNHFYFLYLKLVFYLCPFFYGFVALLLNYRSSSYTRDISKSVIGIAVQNAVPKKIQISFFICCLSFNFDYVNFALQKFCTFIYLNTWMIFLFSFWVCATLSLSHHDEFLNILP